MRSTGALSILLLALLGSALCEQMNVNPSNYQDRLDEFKQRNPTHIAIVVAKWCPDCQASEKTLEHINNDAILHDWSVLDADVGTRDQFRDPSNYMVTDPLYKIHYVPTVYIIRNGVIEFSIMDQQIYDQNLINQILQKIEQGPGAEISTN